MFLSIAERSAAPGWGDPRADGQSGEESVGVPLRALQQPGLQPGRVEMLRDVHAVQGDRRGCGVPS